MFGKLFVDDYQMAPELLWAALVVVLVRFYNWGDIFWWYPHRVLHKDKLASWLPDLRQRVVPVVQEFTPNDEAEELAMPSLKFANWILYAEGITLGTVAAVFLLPSSNDMQVLDNLRLLEQALGQPNDDPSYIFYPAGGLLSWTQAKPLPDIPSLSISTTSPEWKGPTILLTSLLRDPPDRRVTLPSTCTINTDDLPTPNAHTVTRYFLPLAIQDMVTASILDYENVTAALTALSSNGSEGRITRHEPFICTMAACCRDRAEVGQMARGLAAVASVLHSLAMDSLLDEEDDDGTMQLCKTVGAQLRGLRGAARQFRGRCLFVTDNGFQGVSGPELRDIEPGDVVVVVDGVSFPLVIRGSDDQTRGPKVKLVGCALVRGLDTRERRRYEAARLPDDFTVPERQTFDIV